MCFTATFAVHGINKMEDINQSGRAGWYEYAADLDEQKD